MAVTPVNCYVQLTPGVLSVGVSPRAKLASVVSLPFSTYKPASVIDTLSPLLGTDDPEAVDPALAAHDGRVADSGEGRWALQTAIATETAAPLLAQALFQRFTSRDQARYGNRLLSAMRDGFGGHGVVLEIGS